MRGGEGKKKRKGLFLRGQAEAGRREQQGGAGALECEPTSSARWEDEANIWILWLLQAGAMPPLVPLTTPGCSQHSASSNLCTFSSRSYPAESLLQIALPQSVLQTQLWLQGQVAWGLLTLWEECKSLICYELLWAIKCSLTLIVNILGPHIAWKKKLKNKELSTLLKFRISYLHLASETRQSSDQTMHRVPAPNSIWQNLTHISRPNSDSFSLILFNCKESDHSPYPQSNLLILLIIAIVFKMFYLSQLNWVICNRYHILSIPIISAPEIVSFLPSNSPRQL